MSGEHLLFRPSLGNSRRLDFYCLSVRCGKEVESIYGPNDVLPTLLILIDFGS